MKKLDFKKLACTCLALGLLISTASVYGNEENNDDSLTLLLAHSDEDIDGHILAAGCGGGSCGGAPQPPKPSNSNYKKTGVNYNSGCASKSNGSSGSSCAQKSGETYQYNNGSPSSSSCAQRQGNGQYNNGTPTYDNSNSNGCAARPNGGSCGGRSNGNGNGVNEVPSQMSPQNPQSRGYAALEISQVRRTNLI